MQSLFFLFMVSYFVSAEDFNAQGFESYKKGSFKKAQSLFLKSTQVQPQNLYGWYNLGRVTYVLNKSNKSYEVCDWESWPFQVLGYLSKAAHLDGKRVLELLSRKEPQFDKFKKNVLFQKFKAALVYKNTEKISKVFSKYRSWLKEKNEHPSDLYRTYEFQKNGQLEFHDFDGIETSVKLVSSYKISKKQNRILLHNLEAVELEVELKRVGPTNYFFLRLKPSQSHEDLKGPLVLSPAVGDCGKTMI